MIEQQALSTDVRFGDCLDVIERYNARRRQLDADLEHYLDSLEK